MKTSEDDLQDLALRSDRFRRRHLARQPKRAADVMAAVLHRRGYGRMMESEQLTEAWEAIVDARLKPFTRAVRVYRRKLEVVVGNSTVMQELTFVKQALLKEFNQRSAGRPITDIRFRIGEVGE